MYRFMQGAVMGLIVMLAPVWPALPMCEEPDEPQEGSELDLDALEQRLRETNAIGFFTKLALKNEINSLLDAFHAYHTSGSDKDLEQLRERYSLLLFKVMSLVQDEEPQLSQKIYASREAIWCLLADPEEFSKLQAGEKV